jgi:hypothetical protein
MTKQEAIDRMINEGIITISNDPLVPGFGREAKFNGGFIWNPVAKTIMLDFMISYTGEDVPSRLSPKSVTLVADTIDTGDGNEYQAFVDIAGNEIKIFELIYDTVMLRDSQGKLNR